MGKIIVGMTISLDGFVTDRNGSVARLYPDLADFGQSDVMQDAIQSTGAVIMGRRTYDMSSGDFTGYEFQVPLFIVTHHAPAQVAKGENDKLKINFVTDGLESAVRQAQVAAGDKDVTVVGGTNLIQQLLNKGLADELQVGIMPIFLNEGLPLFKQIADLKLELIEVYKTPPRIDICYRIVK
jgi:dihydrofolate reductase